MSTALVTIDPAPHALSYLGVSDGEPLKPVRLSLTQPINSDAEEGTIAGRWLDNQSNFQYTDLNIVVLELRAGRVMFESQDLGAKPICKSDNGVQPKISDDLQRQDYGKGCAKCPMGQWKKVGGRNIKPPCQETMTALTAQLETGFTYRINTKGVGLAPFKDLKETLRKYYLASKAKGMAILPTQLFFKLSSLKVAGQKGTYYIPKLGPPTPIQDEDQLIEIANIHDRLVVNRNVNYEEEGEGTEEAVNPNSDPVADVLHRERTYQAA